MAKMLTIRVGDEAHQMIQERALAARQSMTQWCVERLIAGEGLPVEAGPQLTRQLDGLGQRVAALGQRVAAMEAQLAAQPGGPLVSDGDAMDAFAGRLAGIELRLEALEAGIGPLKLVTARMGSPDNPSRRDPLAAVGPIRSAIHKRPKAAAGECKRCARGCVPEVCACRCHPRTGEEF